MKGPLFLMLLATLGQQARGVDLTSERIIIHKVDFSDPKSDTLFGRNGFDRENLDLGVDTGQVNQAKITVTPPKAAPYVKFESDDTSVASVGTPSNDLLPVSGVSKGFAIINPKQLPSTLLGAFSFGPIHRTIALHIIKDTANPPHVGAISEARVEDALAQAMTTWGKQANVEFVEVAPANTVEIITDFGDAVDLNENNADAPEEKLIVSKASNPNAGINVYFVHNLNFPAPGATRFNHGSVFINVEAALFAKELDRTLAHELGHALGLITGVDYCDNPNTCRIVKPSNLLYHLMWGETGGGLTVIPTQAKDFNPVQ